MDRQLDLVAPAEVAEYLPNKCAEMLGAAAAHRGGTGVGTGGVDQHE
jgi:hypothetical protein